MEASFKHQRVSIVGSTEDGKLKIVFVSNDWHPGKYYLLNTELRKLSLLSDTAPWIKADHGGRTEPFKIKSRDGLEISGYITLPHGKESDLPMVVLPHGGPHGVRDYWEYDSDVQFLSSIGYAVLRINYRGSGGYGTSFEKAGFLNWGSKIQNDIIDATNWAIKENIAEQSKVCIFGASFGGYSAIMSAVISPESFACIVSKVGVFDLVDFINSSDIADISEGENYLQKVLGKDELELKHQSPLFRINEIKAPIFVAHGGKDKRAPFHQAEELIDVLEERRMEFETLLFEREGHGFYKRENRVQFYKKLASFLDKHLKK